MDVPFTSAEDAIDRLSVYHVHQQVVDSDELVRDHEHRVTQETERLISRFVQLEKKFADMRYQQARQTPAEEELFISRALFALERERLHRLKPPVEPAPAPAPSPAVATAAPPRPGGPQLASAAGSPDADLLAASIAEYNRLRAVSETRSLTAEETQLATHHYAVVQKLMPT